MKYMVQSGIIGRVKSCYDIHKYPRWASIPLKGPNIHILSVGVLSGHHYQFLLPTIGTVLPVTNLHGQQKALWKSRPVDISHWRQ